MVGGPGVGKTALCERAAELAGDMRVVRVQGVEEEQTLPLAALADLAAALRDVTEHIAGPAGELLDELATRRTPATTDPLAVGAALLELLAMAAERAPLLVVVDDYQWVEEASLRMVSFAWRRLRDDRVAILVAGRPPVPPVLRGDVLELFGLGRDDAVRLVRRSSATPVAGRVADTLARASGGNPLVLTEVVGLLSPSQLDGSAPLPERLPTGRRAGESFAISIRALPPPSRTALAVVAAAGSGAFDYAPAALAALELEFEDLAPVERAALCRITPGQISLRHPLVGSAAFEAVGSGEYRRIQAALADVTSDMDPIRSANHLYEATVGPSEQVAMTLERAAAGARGDAGVLAAGQLLERAARVTPPGRVRAQRFLRAAAAALDEGRLPSVTHLCEHVTLNTADTETLAQATLLLARATLYTHHPAGLTDELWRLADDPLHGETALAMLVALYTNHGEARGVQAALRRLDAAGPSLHPVAKAYAAIGHCFNGDPKAARALVRSADWAVFASSTDPPLDLAAIAAVAAMYAEEYESALSCTTFLQRRARTEHVVSAMPFLLLVEGGLHWWRGDWRRAVACLHDTVTLGTDCDVRSIVGFAHGYLAAIRATTGDADLTGVHRRAAQRVADEDGVMPMTGYIAYAEGLCALSLGRYEEAVVALRRTQRRCDEMVPDTLVIVPYASDLIDALVATRRLDEARRALDDTARRARAQASPWGAVVVARGRALLAADDGWEASLSLALEMAGESFPFERAKTHLSFGQRLGREGRTGAARDHLQLALDLFDGLGATAWVERAASELRARHTRASATRRRSDELTPQELRVCLAVAEGATNREAAQALFLSTKTIETHLARAYRKLGVTSRSQLARLVASTSMGGGALGNY
jgi:DNA-binding CsgD family transcriptional regulator